MRTMRLRIAIFKLVAALAIAGAVSTSLLAEDRHLVNAWDVRDEIKLAPGVDPSAVQDYFPSFYDYLDTVLFHPTAGYYSSGRVNFSSDYQTFPIALYPSFGQMITEHMFQMWDGMRKAGTLGPKEKFTIAEFGAGDGAMAESVLEYIDRQAAANADPRWKEFKEQTVYACYDRSPALSAKQRKRNERFGARFDARLGDATDPGATIPPESLKGVILSNELPDCFSVHKVILSMNGAAEIAFTVPSVPMENWKKIEASLPAAARQSILKDDRTVYEKLFAGAKNGQTGARDRVYLSKAGFSAILDAFSASANYEVKVNLLHFQEVYVPVTVIPELAEHLRQYAHAYAYALTKSGKGMVTYINLGEGKFIKGAGSGAQSRLCDHDRLRLELGRHSGAGIRPSPHVRTGKLHFSGQSVSHADTKRYDHRRKLQPPGGRRENGGTRSALFRTSAFAATRDFDRSGFAAGGPHTHPRRRDGISELGRPVL